MPQPIFDQLVSILERLDSITAHLDRVKTDVHELKMSILLEVSEGEDDDTFLLENDDNY